MTVTCVIQARMGSSRRPGKVLADVGGRPILRLMIDRLRPLEVDHLVVATSSLARDDPVARLASETGVGVVRGSETDVLGRFVTALDHYPADVAVRLTADCPLIDPAIVEAALELRRRTGADYASNTLVRTFPDGLDVEVATASALREAAAEATDASEREHVTPFLYRRPDRYRLAALRAQEMLGDERWTIDTDDDLDRVRGIVALLPAPERAGWGEIMSLVGRHFSPDPRAIHLRPALDGEDATIDALRRAGSVSFGDGRPHAPVASHLTEPSVRTWVAEVDHQPVGWAQVSVEMGLGTCRGAAVAGRMDELLTALRQVLSADQQVLKVDAGEVENDSYGDD